MSKDTVSIRNNKTGEEAEFSLLSGTLGTSTVDIGSLNKNLGLFTYDPGFFSTASCKSSITYIDGDQGILLYRGYPIEQLAKQSSFLEVSYLLMNGSLPHDNELDTFEQEINQHANLHEVFIKCLDGFDYGAHPMAMMVSMLGSLSAFYHDQLNMNNFEDRRIVAMRLLAKMPTIAVACYRHSMGYRMAYPDRNLGYCKNILTMILAEPLQLSKSKEGVADSIAIKALNLLFILHADHEQNASTSTVRLASSTGANPYACIAAGITALWGPAHGGANEAVLTMLAEIGSVDHIPKYLAKAKDKDDPFRLMGFGHRVYKNFDPRATIIRETCHEVLEHFPSNDPLFELALALEEHALKDEYFIEKKLYPNVDFYSGIIYRALGIPENMFTAMFVIARTAGWVSHWLEMTADPTSRISRPRQLYTGLSQRDYEKNL